MMDDATRADFMEAFKEASKPFHVSLKENKQAIVDHAIEAASHNLRQDGVLASIAAQHKTMQDNQTTYHNGLSALTATIAGIDRKLDAQDKKIDQQNLNTGELIGTVKSLANQNKEQYGRLVALETHAAIGDSAKGAVMSRPPLLAGFFDNKVVQVGIIAIVIITLYGIFQYVGVDVSGAKSLISDAPSTSNDGGST